MADKIRVHRSHIKPKYAQMKGWRGSQRKLRRLVDEIIRNGNNKDRRKKGELPKNKRMD